MMEAQQPQLIDIKTAVQRARNQAKELFEPESLPNLALEEVEFDEDEQHWLITLGYDSPHHVKRQTGPNLFPTIEEERKREYKVFRIDPKDGHLISITLRNL